MRIAAGLAAICACVAAAQEPDLTSIYVDLPAGRCQASVELVLKVDERDVAIKRATPGPHPVSAVLLFDTSPSMLAQPIDAIARRIARTVQSPDRLILGTFSPKVVFSRTALTSQDAASQATREVSQKQVGHGGPSPLWDALYDSVAMPAPAGIRVVVVFTDARASGNDRGYADVQDLFARAGAAAVVVALGDDALPRNSNMQVIGRNDALRRLASDSAGHYTELTRANSAPPYAFLVESLRNLRYRCRLEIERPSGLNTARRLSLTWAGVSVRAPARVPDR